MILCAAIKFYINNTDKIIVMPCRRHSEAYQTLKDLGFEAKDGYKEITQGFITTENEFLNRREAWVHAIRCGQISQTTLHHKEDFKINSDELYSEDIY